MAAIYIDTGGFPEAQSLEAGLRRDVLRNYLDVAIFRDVVERHGVGNIEALRSLIRHAVSAPGGRFSVNRFYNTMRSQGISCTKNNLYDYLDYLMDAFLLYQTSIHARSERVRRVNPRKLYVVDSGIIKAMSVRMTRDDGALLENLVFMHLRRQGLHPDYYITAAGAEVDFVFNTLRDDKPRLVQVCWDLSSPETRTREVDSLFAAMKELGVERGTIVTWLNEADEGAVEIVPAWKWLLSKEE